MKAAPKGAADNEAIMAWLKPCPDATHGAWDRLPECYMRLFR